MTKNLELGQFGGKVSVNDINEYISLGSTLQGPIEISGDTNLTGIATANSAIINQSVGIGTDTARADLDIVSDYVDWGANLSIRTKTGIGTSAKNTVAFHDLNGFGSSSLLGYIGFNDSTTNDLKIYNHSPFNRSAGNISIGFGLTERVTIVDATTDNSFPAGVAAAKIGIGVTNPSYNIDIHSHAPIIRLAGDGSDVYSGGYIILQSPNNALYDAGIGTFKSILITCQDGDLNDQAYFEIQRRGEPSVFNGSILSYNDKKGFSFRTPNTPASQNCVERLGITANTTIPYVYTEETVQVGLGTTAPKERLVVDSGPIFASVVDYNNTQNAPYLIAGNHNFYTAGAATTTSWGTYGIQHRIKANANGVPRVTIDTPQSGEVFSVNNSGFVGIGLTQNINAQALCRLQIGGLEANASFAPKIRLTTNVNNYPLLEIQGFRKDNSSIAFDSYYNGTWRSSDQGSNFIVTKLYDTLRIATSSGISSGSDIGLLTTEDDFAVIGITTERKVGIQTYQPKESLHVVGNVRVDNSFPDSRPALLCNFSESKKLDPRFKFERGSSASYVGPDGFIKFAPPDTPRFDHDPTTNESLGLLLENGASNYVTFNYDSSLIDTNQTNSSTALNVPNVIAPDGTRTSGVITASSAAQSGSTQYGLSKLTSNADLRSNKVCLSVFAKAGIHTYARLQTAAISNWSTNAGISVDLSNGSIISGVGHTWGVTPYKNGWYRIHCVAEANSNASGRGMWVFLAEDNGSSIPYLTNTGTEDIYVWGPQLEVSNYLTSYIKTGNGTGVSSTLKVTRATEYVGIGGIKNSEWWNEGVNEFTDFIHFSVDSPLPTSSPYNGGLVSYWSDGSGYENRIAYGYPTTGNAVLTRAISNNYGLFGNGALGTKANVRHISKIATKWSIPNYESGSRSWTFAIDGKLYGLGVGTTNSVPDLNRFYLGNIPGITPDVGRKHIRQYAFWNKTYDDNTIAGLTTT